MNDLLDGRLGVLSLNRDPLSLQSALLSDFLQGYDSNM